MEDQVTGQISTPVDGIGLEEKAERLHRLVNHAYTSAPAVREIFDRAGVSPEDIRAPTDLARIPVTKKEHLLEAQRAAPPFGGFLTVPLERLRHIFVSPGPIYDPDPAGGQRNTGFQRMFQREGIGPGDRALVTWSYHLVPAGLLQDEAFTALGVTVIPAGVGNTELQARMIPELQVTVVSASTAFFTALMEKVEELGYDVRRDCHLRLALLGGEMGVGWLDRRRALEERYGMRTFTFYGTADVGLVGYECPSRDGYHIADDVIVEVCDPSTGTRLPAGQVGEIVVTGFNEVYPLIRFGTGDASMLVPGPCACGDPTPRLAHLSGRVAEAVKVREIFVYRRQFEEVVSRVAGVARVQAVITRAGSREELHVHVEPERPDIDRAATADAIREAVQTLCRVRADRVEFMEPGSLAADAPVVLDRKDA